MSGIATRTAEYVRLTEGTRAKILDTRKTAPGQRVLDKYAVKTGGGTNHRMGLWDMALVKDNHLRVAGGSVRAIEAIRAAHPTVPIEVEADDVASALRAVEGGADLVLLDNMDAFTLAEAVRVCRAAADARGRGVALEASGGIGLEGVAAIVSAGVDRISTSKLTMARPLDFGLDEMCER
jgi:nicotinate-nucleotide pyrophosphorylase (carboxylating)